MKKTPLVSLVSGEDRKENIIKSLGLIKADLGKIKKAKKILIKPNLTSAYNPYASTQAEAVAAILEFLKDFDPGFTKKQFDLAETSGEAFNRGEAMSAVFNRFGFKSLLDQYSNLQIRDLEQGEKYFPVKISSLKGEIEVRIPQQLKDYDYQISVALPKTHDTVIVTLGIKNFLMGVVKTEDKFKMHGFWDLSYGDRKVPDKLLSRLAWVWNKKAPWRLLYLTYQFLPSFLLDRAIGFRAGTFIDSAACLHQNLCLVAEKVWPDLVVIDGFYGMEADGPLYGQKRRLGIAIASVDPVAADWIGTKIIGFDPQKVAYLRYLAQKHQTKYQLVGEKVAWLAQKFKPHHYYSYQLKASQSVKSD